MESKKNFDAIKWVRKVRDKFYEEHKNLKGMDYINAIRTDISKKTNKSKTKTQKKKEFA